MNIRKMVPGDYDALYALWLSCKGMGLNDLDDSRAGIGRFLVRNPDTCWVAEAENRIVGAIMAGHDGRRGYIYHTAVHERYRRQGIARQLVDAVLQAFGQLGIHKVALVAFKRNEAGNRFWECVGFTVRDDLVYRNKALVEMIRTDT